MNPLPPRFSGLPFEIRSDKPSRFSPSELDEFEKMVRKGGEVSATMLAAGLRRAEWLFEAAREGRVIGIAALKRPFQNYRSKICRHSGTEVPVAAYPYEVGYIFVAENERGKGHSQRLIQAVIENSAQSGLFATVRTENGPMRHVLEKFGFRTAGIPYRSERGDYELVLYLRSSPASLRAESPLSSRP
jgi:GNAT superfamily N-acetyltransferase